MDNLLNKKKDYRDELRKGKVVNMDNFLSEMDSEYIADLDGSISSFDNYDAISHETFNDYLVISGKLEILHILGYLDEEELNAIRQTAAEMRLKKLEALEHEENRS